MAILQQVYRAWGFPAACYIQLLGYCQATGMLNNDVLPDWKTSLSVMLIGNMELIKRVKKNDNREDEWSIPDTGCPRWQYGWRRRNYWATSLDDYGELPLIRQHALSTISQCYMITASSETSHGNASLGWNKILLITLFAVHHLW